jgi:hypothetical protein
MDLLKEDISRIKEIMGLIVESEDRVTCDECEWSWKLSEGGDDPYTCHECGHTNKVKEGEIEEQEGVQFDSSEKNTIDDFVEFVKKKLGIDNEVDVQLQNNKDGIRTTAVYKYQDEGDKDFEQSEIRVFALGRALVDVLRSIAHEMVHHKQNEDGELKGKHSKVGGPIEDEANAVAGEMIKVYGLDHPEIYPEGYNDEETNEGEIDEQEEGGEPAPSGPAMSTWETGITRGKANPIDATSKWDSGIERGKGNPVW